MQSPPQERIGKGEPSVFFDAFELRLKSGELCRNGVTVKLSPQPFNVLKLLLENAGQVVTREEFRQQIWGDHTFVDFDKGLNFCIKQIREALGDQAQAPHYIETLPRRGYRFIAAVDLSAATPSPVAKELAPAEGEPTVSALSHLASLSAAATQARPPSRPAAATGSVLILRQWGRRVAIAALLLLPLGGWMLWQQGRSTPLAGRVMLAVLPFENLNGDAAQDYFSDGLTEEMIAQLGRLQPQRLGVIARTTALTYKKSQKDIRQIGRELGVGYVLEGSVRRDAERVRITAQLIQVSDQTHLWSETYERSERDLLALQSEVAGRVARSLAVELLPAAQASAQPAPPQPEAYDAYLKALFLVTKDTLPDLERSLAYFDEATAKDPQFAAAYAAAVEARVLLSSWKDLPADRMMEKAKADAQQAVALAPGLAEAYAAQGAVSFRFDWDWEEAEKNFRRALELNPSNPNTHLHYANLLICLRQPDAAVRHIEQALALDPVSLLTNGLSAYAYLRARRYDEAIRQAERMLELEPQSPAAHDCLTSAYYYQGKYEEMRQVLLKRAGNDPARAQLAAELRQGDARQTIARFEGKEYQGLLAAVEKGRPISAAWAAQRAARFGDKERAVEWLEKAYADRLPSLVTLNVHPAWDGLRQDARFIDIVRRMRLTP